MPIVFFHGNLDSLTYKSDVDWLLNQLGESVVYEEQLKAGHITFLIGEDMTWFSERALDYVYKLHVDDDCWFAFFC